TRIAARQQQLNRQAAKLTSDEAQRALVRALQAMGQAKQALAANDAGQAQQRQQEAASALEDLARQLPAPPPAPEPGPAPKGLPAPEQVEGARGLAEEQRALHKALQQLTAQPTPAKSAGPAPNPIADLLKQQQEIARRAAGLARALGPKEGPQTKQADQAAQST